MEFICVLNENIAESTQESVAESTQELVAEPTQEFIAESVAVSNQDWTISADEPRLSIKNVEELCIKKYKDCNVFVIENLFSPTFCDNMIRTIKSIPLRKTHYGPGENVLCYCAHFEKMLEEEEKSYYPLSTNHVEFKRLITAAKSKSNSNSQSLRTTQWNGLTKREMNHLMEQINSRIQLLKDVMKDINPSLQFDYNSGYLLRKIYGPTKPHSDGIHSSCANRCCLNYIAEKYSKSRELYRKTFVRNSSAIVALNDEFASPEGATFRFPDFELSLRLKKGSMIIFPPFWTHKHEVSDAKHMFYKKQNELEPIESNTIDEDLLFRYTLSTWFCEEL
jgi:hypothetical protein